MSTHAAAAPVLWRGGHRVLQRDTWATARPPPLPDDPAMLHHFEDGALSPGESRFLLYWVRVRSGR